MAKSYVLSEKDRETLTRLIRWWRGGGPGKSSRPTPTRRRNYSGGGGSTPRRRALIIGNVQAATFDANAQRISTGGSNGEKVAVVMTWSGAGTLVKDEEYEPLECINATSLSGVFATPDEPVSMAGSVESISGDDYFVLEPFDLYSLEGNELGSTSNGEDDPDMKIPFKSGGQRNYKTNSRDCSGA